MTARERKLEELKIKEMYYGEEMRDEWYYGVEDEAYELLGTELEK